MLKVGQLPEDVERRKKARQRNTSILVLILVAILLGGAYGGITFYKNRVEQKLNGLENQIKQIEDEITEKERDLDEALLAQKQLDNLKRLLNNRLYWTNLFQRLGDITIPDVFYRGLKGDIKNRLVSLPASARSYKALAKQLKAWEGVDVLESVSVESASLEITEEYAGIFFDADLTFLESAWQE